MATYREAVWFIDIDETLRKEFGVDIVNDGNTLWAASSDVLQAVLSREAPLQHVEDLPDLDHNDYYQFLCNQVEAIRGPFLEKIKAAYFDATGIKGNWTP